MTEKTTVIIIDDEPEIGNLLKHVIVSQCNCNVIAFRDGRDAFPVLAAGGVAACIVDWMMPYPGEEVLKYVTANHPDVQVFIMTALNHTETAVHAMKLGATNYMTKPLDNVRIIAETKCAIKLFEANQYSRRLSETILKGESVDNHGIIYNSESMGRLMLYIQGMAKSRQPVLITGETGTGKEGVARAIHKSSGVSGEFVAVNIAGLDTNMVADTLFGHKKGAFTGADAATEGLIAKAENGTLFLDEIGDLAEENQIKLLRVLQEGEYYRLGSTALMKANIRVVAATNKNFADKRIFKSFRQDLYYRISTLNFTIPPLRDRAEDIPVLAVAFAAEVCAGLGKTPPVFSREALTVMEVYEYPGNVRELKNIVSEICLRNHNGVITPNDFPAYMPRPMVKADELSQLDTHPLAGIFGRFPTVDELEKYAINEVMKITKGNQSSTARILNISRPTLNKRLKTMGHPS